MSKHGDDLLADLNDLVYLGNTTLSQAADSLQTAWANIPGSVSGETYRSGCIGYGANGPGAEIDAALAVLNHALLTSATNTRDVGTGVVTLARQFAATDETCAAAFHVTYRKVDGISR